MRQSALWLRAFWVGVALTLANAAEAETRALIVAVSNYDGDAITDLKGPANDARLMRDILARRGVTDIRVLADGVADSARPTSAAILGAMAALAQEVTKGDFVYIHFSGHGTRQADPEGDETDGLDEVFLAIDADRAAAGTGLIPGAVVDDEIGRAVAAIRAKGADVWLVMDSCHAGSALRAGVQRTAPRFVEPAALGVSVAIRGRPDAIVDTPEGADLSGGYLAFYAAQSSEVAREVDLGSEAREDWYGLFTAKLAGRLAGAEEVTFRQLFQSVTSDLYDTTLPGAARRQTPSWEGSLIDAAVFGGQATQGIRRFRVKGDEIEAGLLHGLAEGTLVALVADAASPPDAVLGYAQVELPEATHGFLRPVDAGCTPEAAAPCPVAGPLPAGARFAQVVARPLDLLTRLAPPTDTDGRALPDTAPPVAALDAALREAQTAGHALTVDPASWDVQVIWDGTNLWFGPRAEIGGAPVGASWAPGDVPLAPLLARIAQAETLAQTLGAVAREASPLNPSPVDLTARIATVRATDLAPAGQPVSPARECRRANAGKAAPSALPLGAGVKQCDTLEFAAQGNTAGAWDVNRIYIDAQYCIRVDHELIEGAVAPRRLGPDMTMCSECPAGNGAGEERLFVVVTNVAENAEPLNLQGLLDNCTGAGSTRGPAGQAALDLLTATARRPGTRGMFGGFGVAGIWVEALNWRVLPRGVALARSGAAAQAE